MDEAEAIRRAAAGDRDAQGTLYTLHRRRVYALCLRMTRNAADAEDLAQEVFLHLFRKVGTFRGESAFSTWLHRLTVNLVLMHLRRKRLPETPLDEFAEPVHEDGPRRELGARDQNLTGSIDRVILERAIARLPPGYRTVFVLHDVEGYGRNEIAARMGCAREAASVGLWRARAALAAALDRERATIAETAAGPPLRDCGGASHIRR